MRKVLFVDDEDINLFVFQKRYEKSLNVLTANNGELAREILKDNYADLEIVISDFKMPDEEGLDLLAALKTMKETLVCYLLTGYEDTQEILNAKKSGLVKEVFRKPVNYDLLEKELTDAPL
ncbi:MAG: response regulator [Bacteroidota bacterium]